MATAEAIAIRQQTALKRIDAAGFKLPHVKGTPPFRMAVYLEMIADAIQRGDITINTKGASNG